MSAAAKQTRCGWCKQTSCAGELREEHAAKKRASRVKSTQARIKAGTCVRCGKLPPTPGTSICVTCGAKQRTIQLKYRRKRYDSPDRIRPPRARGRWTWHGHVPEPIIVSNPFAKQIPDDHAGCLAACPWLRD